MTRHALFIQRPPLVCLSLACPCSCFVFCRVCFCAVLSGVGTWQAGLYNTQHLDARRPSSCLYSTSVRVREERRRRSERVKCARLDLCPSVSRTRDDECNPLTFGPLPRLCLSSAFSHPIATLNLIGSTSSSSSEEQLTFPLRRAHASLPRPIPFPFPFPFPPVSLLPRK